LVRRDNDARRFGGRGRVLRVLLWGFWGRRRGRHGLDAFFFRRSLGRSGSRVDGDRLARRRNGGCRGRHRNRASDCPEPVFRRRGNAPDIRGDLQFDTDLRELARTPRRVDGTHQGTHQGRFRSASDFRDLERDPCSDTKIMPRRIAATVQIETEGGGSFLKRLTKTVLAGNNQRNRIFDACAATSFHAGERAKSVGGSGQARTSPTAFKQEAYHC